MCRNFLPWVTGEGNAWMETGSQKVTDSMTNIQETNSNVSVCTFPALLRLPFPILSNHDTRGADSFQNKGIIRQGDDLLLEFEITVFR